MLTLENLPGEHFSHGLCIPFLLIVWIFSSLPNGFSRRVLRRQTRARIIATSRRLFVRAG